MMKKRLFIYFLHLFGIVLISVFGYFRLQATASDAAEFLQQSTQNTLSNVQTFYDDVLSDTIRNDNCESFLNASHHYIYKHPSVRSVSLTDSGAITCSTVSKAQKIHMTDWQPAEEINTRLFYTTRTPFKNRELSMQHGVLLLKIPMSKFIDTTIAFHPEVFKQAIRFNSNFNLSLHFEDVVFTPSGIAYLNETKTPDEILHNPLFDVSYRITPPIILTYLLDNYGILIALWVILIVFAGTPLYNSYRNHNLTYLKIRNALKNKQFEPYLQPIFNQEGQITGAEILARWIHPQRGVISPAEFIEIAENNGQIIEITTQLLEKTVEKLQHFQFDQPFFLALNVCPIQFENETLFNDCQRALERLSGKNIQLVIELTERKEFTDNEAYMTYIERLKESNIKIALDDFGTGHCSLKYVHQVNIDYIKIDKSYIDTIDNNTNTNVLDNIIDLAKRIQAPLVAEGIETQTQFNYLKSKQITYYQGFLFERPIPLNDFVGKYLVK